MSVPIDLSRLHLPDHVEALVQRGAFGRAREILASRLSQNGYDPGALEQLGCVLLRMGDHVAAGRNLFLSGRRAAPYETAIQVFLTRVRNCNLEQFASQWPRKVRRVRIVDLSAAVQDELRARGADWRDSEQTLEDLRGRGAGRPRGLIALVVICVFLVIAGVLVAHLSRR